MRIASCEPLISIVLLHLAAFGVMALNCHVDLAKDRPETSRLTEFYFWVSLGGMLGGLFNALAAPVLFDSIIEYPVGVVLACLFFRATDAPVVSRLRAADETGLPLNRFPTACPYSALNALDERFWPGGGADFEE